MLAGGQAGVGRTFARNRENLYSDASEVPLILNDYLVRAGGTMPRGTGRG